MNQATTISSPLDDTLAVDVIARIDLSQRYTLLPMDLAKRLALNISERTGIASASITLHGHAGISPVRVSDSVNHVVVGLITLQALALTLDESTGELTDSEYLLYVA